MTTEEKAKAYDEALEKARAYHKSTCLRNTLEALENIFPELAESDDETIRKELITHCRNIKCVTEEGAKKMAKWIAWLEKQGEQKSVDKVEPRFKVGDKVYALRDRFECTIESIDELTYYGDTTNFDIKDQDNWKLVEQKPTDKVEPKFKVGDWVVDNKNGIVKQILSYKHGVYKHTYGYSGKIFENEWRLWDITKDAKDGDVLACESGWTCIFKSLNAGDTFSSYCFMDRTKSFFETGSECHTLNEEFTKAYNGEIKPATKEQRDTLMKAMADAGYTFDFEKKELNKIEQKPVNSYCQENCKGFQETGKCFADWDCKAKREAESIDKVEPNFNVGDWVVENGVNRNPVQIISFEEDKGSGIKVWFSNGTGTYIEFLKCYHKWTIQDAKDGDVIASELCDSIVLFKGIKDGNIDFYCDYDFSKIDIPGDRFTVNNGQHYGNVEDSKDFHPATKEQRDLLFQKMHEASYTFDFEKKELNKI